MNEIETTQFKDRQTGLTWTKSFMKRNKLSHKKTKMISSARKSNKANPYTIYDFFDQLVEVGDDSGNTFFVLHHHHQSMYLYCFIACNENFIYSLKKST